MCKKEFVSNLFSSLMGGMKSCRSTTAEIETWLLWTRYSELHLSVGFFFSLYFCMSSRAALFCFPITDGSGATLWKNSEAASFDLQNFHADIGISSSPAQRLSNLRAVQPPIFPGMALSGCLLTHIRSSRKITHLPSVKTTSS